MTSDMACVYVITNTVNNKQYVGVTKNPKTRMNAHACHTIPTKAAIKNAIKAYGRDKFKMEILFYGTQEYCYQMEPKIISLYNTKSPSGYNICSGGRGAIGLVGELNGMYGRLGELHPNYGKPGYRTGKFHSEETKAKMRQSHLGQKRSEESKEKMRIQAKKRFENPEYVAKLRASGFGSVNKKD